MLAKLCRDMEAAGQSDSEDLLAIVSDMGAEQRRFFVALDLLLGGQTGTWAGTTGTEATDDGAGGTPSAHA
jgi:hypothetical protein